MGAASRTTVIPPPCESAASQYRVGLLRFESGRVLVVQGGVFECSSRMNGKPSSPVLRGLGASDGARLLDPNRVTSELPVIRPGSGTELPKSGLLDRNTLRVARHLLSRTYRKLGASQLSQQHEGQIIPALWVVNPLSDGAGNHRDDVVERLVNLGH